MPSLLLAEELFLLTHDDESGKQDNAVALPNALCGALLLDLATEGLLVSKDDALVAVPGTASHPLLAAAHEALLEVGEPRRADRLINKLARSLTSVGNQVGESLVGRGVLDQQRGKVLGMFPRTTWPELDPAPERDLRERLRAALVDGADPDPRLAQLISLLSGLNLAGRIFDKAERKAAQKRAKEIADSGVALSADVAKSIRDVQAAVMVATMMPIIVANN